MKNRNELAKKVDKSLLMGARFTIPQENLGMCLQGEDIFPGKNREIKIIFNKKEYSGVIRHVNQTKSNKVYQIQWHQDKKLQLELKKEFVQSVQSYIAIMSDIYQKKLTSEKKYRTNLAGGEQEVIKIIEVDKNIFKIESFIKIKSPYSNLFKKLIENNVFAWIDKSAEETRMIIKETEWYDISELKNHEDVRYVIYYLIDDRNKKIYIGSAKRLGNRVKPGRQEIPDWNKFRYEILNPNYYGMLREIEYHSIDNFARFIKNSKMKSIDISDYVLTNKKYGYYRQ